ncbi:MAG TPA: YihY/virulence factor BrkB family protein [Acidimicrobiales bacterium]|nr:YihY/virulence factor BrkB family protein [Acidimicrobiales bacterium]
MSRASDGGSPASRRGRANAILVFVFAVLWEQSQERLSLAASGAAFWIVISAFPTALAVVSLFGLVVSPARLTAGIGHLASTVPGSFGELLTAQLRRVATVGHAQLTLGLVFSLVLATWSASAGVRQLAGAIRAAYGLEPWGLLRARVRSIVSAAGVVVAIGAVAVVTPAVVGHPSALRTVLDLLAALVVVTGITGVLYRLSVGGHVAVRSLVPGAVASAVATVLVIAGFGAYVSASSRFTAVYGAFAGAVVAMFALYLVVYVILLGAVVNMLMEGGVRARSDA